MSASSPSKPSPIVLSATEVLSRKHFSSALVLAMSAGAVNAGALAVCDRFVAHVSGNLTLMGVDAGKWWLFAEYALVLVAFILGAMASVMAIQGRTLMGKLPVPAVPLFATVGILLAAAGLGALGVFGPAAGVSEESGDFALMSILAFAMGLMNASVASSTTFTLRTTHMTGPATDFGVGLGTAWYSRGEERRQALRLAALRGGKILSFAVGAAFMFPLTQVVGYWAFAAPAVLVVVATLRSFLRSSIVDDAGGHAAPAR